MKFLTTVVMHHPEYRDGSTDTFEETIESVFNLMNKDFNVIVLGNSGTPEMLKDTPAEVTVINTEGMNTGQQLNQCLQLSKSHYILYIDNRKQPVILKKASLDTFLVGAERNPGAGLFYADYDLEDAKDNREVKLLYHHPGRLRDNQDYGKVFFFTREALEKAHGFDESLKYHTLYDIRLKISEHDKLIRIANKYSGSLYKVKATGSKTNVFDYLLSGKDLQLEAEAVVTAHLKRIGAYLNPGDFFPVRKKVSEQYNLEASVIIPVGFRPEFIGSAIESIQAQTVKNIEAIIVVNGGDDDPTIPEVKKYMNGGVHYDPDKPEIRLLVIDINSIGLCLNLGVNMARGRYYVQLDSDDRLKPDAVEKILSAFQSADNIGIVIGSYEVWELKENGTLSRMKEIPVVTHDEWTEENGRNNLLRINGAGAPRAIPIHVVKEMGYFGINDDAYSRNYGEDYEMVNKIAEHYRVARIYDPIYEVIRHAGGTDHAINQDVIDRNDEAKDDMRLHAIQRRITFNKSKQQSINADPHA